MFDIGATELLLVAMVALIIIGPKDLPLAMRTAGRWMGQIRGMTKHFRVGIDAMIRDAEIEEQEKEWAERNAKIMREHPDAGTSATADAARAEGDAVMKPIDPGTDSGIESGMDRGEKQPDAEKHTGKPAADARGHAVEPSHEDAKREPSAGEEPSGADRPASGAPEKK